MCKIIIWYNAIQSEPEHRREKSMILQCAETLIKKQFSGEGEPRPELFWSEHYHYEAWEAYTGKGDINIK